MNGIQKYLIDTALDAAREAVGSLIATSKLSPVLVAQCFEEFAEALKLLDETTESNVPCDLEYAGCKSIRQNSSNRIVPTSAPIFVKPSPKN